MGGGGSCSFVRNTWFKSLDPRSLFNDRLEIGNSTAGKTFRFLCITIDRGEFPGAGWLSKGQNHQLLFPGPTAQGKQMPLLSY